jgi:hypothetical protein
MLIMAVHQTPSLTQERYEEVVLRLTNGKSRIDSPSDLPVAGLLMHVAGQGKNGFCIVDVFESEEAVRRFNEAMGSIPREVGIEQPPEFFPAHTFISGDAGQIATCSAATPRGPHQGPESPWPPTASSPSVTSAS